MKPRRDSQSLSTFKRDTAKIMRQLKKTGQPIVLTVRGKPELIVQDAESYQRQDRMETVEGIRRGLDSMNRNAGKPAEEFFREFSPRNASVTANQAAIDGPTKESESRKPPSHETAGVLRALRRAARKALELGIKTGTPVYVMRNNKIVDLTKDQRATKKSRSRRTSAKKVMKRSVKPKRKRRAKRNLFAELSEGMEALADTRRRKRTLRTHSMEYR
jgi:prevent-host-death family protein